MNPIDSISPLLSKQSHAPQRINHVINSAHSCADKNLVLSETASVMESETIPTPFGTRFEH